MRDQISHRIADVSKTVADNYHETNERVLDAVVENSRKAADLYVKAADQVVEQLPTIDLPFELPTPAEAAERYMELVNRIVEANRDFSERVVELNREYTDRVVAMIAGATAGAKATRTVATKTADTATAGAAQVKGAAKGAARKSAKRTATKRTATKRTAKKATSSK